MNPHLYFCPIQRRVENVSRLKAGIMSSLLVHPTLGPWTWVISIRQGLEGQSDPSLQYAAGKAGMFGGS